MDVSPGQRWADNHDPDDTLDVLERVTFGEFAGLWRVRLSTGQTNACVDDEYFKFCRFVGPAPVVAFELMREGVPFRPDCLPKPDPAS